MAQIRGTAGYQLSNQSPFGGPKLDGDDPSPLDTIRAQTSKIEDILDSLSEPVKPYVKHPCPVLCPILCPVPCPAVRSCRGNMRQCIVGFIYVLSSTCLVCISPGLLIQLFFSSFFSFSVCLVANSANVSSSPCRYLPAIGRFLIVVTFLEDALRIMTQWTDQLVYLHSYRHSKKLGSATSLPKSEGCSLTRPSPQSRTV